MVTVEPYVQQFLRQYRFWFHKKGLSQAEIAERLGVDPTSVTAWARGKNFPSLFNLYRLVEVWDIDLETFFRRRTRSRGVRNAEAAS